MIKIPINNTDNENRFVDLHIHTNYSDGIYSPAEIVQFAKKVGLSAIAITDHDMTDGISPAIEEGKKHGIEVIPGVEFSCDSTEKLGGEMHILGYFSDWNGSKLQEELKAFREFRVLRAQEMIKKLSKLNVLVDEAEVLKNSSNIAIGRMHLARHMVDEGLAYNLKECFDKYLGHGKPAYFPKRKVNSADLIELILKSGGVPVIAHPALGADDFEVVKDMKEHGLIGIEVYALRNTKDAVEKYLQWAKELDLIITGGSDFHYSENSKSGILGVMKVKYEIVEVLKEKINLTAVN